MRHTRRTIAAVSILGLLFITSTALADFNPGKWKWKKDILGIEPAESGMYVNVHLDREVSFHASPDLSDLRVLEDGVETPYQLVTLSDSVESDYIASTLRDLSTQGDETTFVLDLSESGVLSDHLRILTDSKNFKREVSVYAADSALPVSSPNWRMLTSSGYIYNFHDEKSNFDAGSGVVTYPENSSRYLKVVIGKGEGERVTVSGAEVFRLLSRESVENVVATAATVAHNSEHKTTEITVDLGDTGLPTHRITLTASTSNNFNRRALVLGSNDAVNWSALGDGYLFSLNTPLFSGAALTLPYKETRARYIRVLVLDQDDVPVSWNQHVTVESTVRAVVFMVRAGKKYELYYGNPDAVTPSYDLSRYFQYIESTVLAKATLGGESQSSDYAAPLAPKVPYTESHPNILTAALILLVAVLTFFLIAHLKHLKNTERGSNE